MSSGRDGISNTVIKASMPIISKPLSLIINQVLNTGIFPDNLKIAKVVPLYKKRDNGLFTNYRPISLLSSVSKIFERVIFNQLIQYFDRYKLLYTSQYGFRKNHSTELAALEFKDGQWPYPCGHFYRFVRFVKDHNILLAKLEFYVVKGLSNELFKNYLTNRQKYVSLEDKSSIFWK